MWGLHLGSSVRTPVHWDAIVQAGSADSMSFWTMPGPCLWHGDGGCGIAGAHDLHARNLRRVPRRGTDRELPGQQLLPQRRHVGLALRQLGLQLPYPLLRARQTATEATESVTRVGTKAQDLNRACQSAGGMAAGGLTNCTRHHLSCSHITRLNRYLSSMMLRGFAPDKTGKGEGLAAADNRMQPEYPLTVIETPVHSRQVSVRLCIAQWGRPRIVCGSRSTCSSLRAAFRALLWRRVSRSSLVSFCSSACSSVNLNFLRCLRRQPKASSRAQHWHNCVIRSMLDGRRPAQSALFAIGKIRAVRCANRAICGAVSTKCRQEFVTASSSVISPYVLLVCRLTAARDVIVYV